MEQVHEATQQLPRVEQRIPMSYLEYQQRFDEDAHVEWVNGEAIVFMSPSIRHQDIVVFLIGLLSGFVKVFRLGKILAAPCEMRFEAIDSSREPDILFVAKANYGRLSKNRIDGPADLVVEVISPESINLDRGEKFYEYQDNGVREYWVIDPRTGSTRADFWVLGEDGRYQPMPVEPNSIYHSTVLPNFKLDVNNLLTDEELDPVQALIDMVGLETLARQRGQDR